MIGDDYSDLPLCLRMLLLEHCENQPACDFDGTTEIQQCVPGQMPLQTFASKAHDSKICEELLRPFQRKLQICEILGLVLLSSGM